MSHHPPPSPPQSWGAYLLSCVEFVIVLASIFAIAHFGHKYHWSIPTFGSDAHAHDEITPKERREKEAVKEAKRVEAEDETRPNVKRGDASSSGLPLQHGQDLASSEVAVAVETPKVSPVVVDPLVDAESVKLESSEAVKQAGLRFSTATLQTVGQDVEAFAEVRYDETRRAQLAARVPGVVWRVEKRLGEPIAKGDVLAIVDALEVGKQKADLLTSVVELDLKVETLRRLEEIPEAVSQQRIRETIAEKNVARVRKFNAIQALINLGFPVDIKKMDRFQDDELFEYIHFLGLPSQLVKSLDPVTTTASLIPIYAPFDGVVTGRDVVVGEYVTPAGQQFEMVDITRMWILLNIKKEFIPLVDLNDTILFTSVAFRGEVEGKISWIASEVDSKTRSLLMRAEVENPLADAEEDPRFGQRLLKANTFGTARIRVRERPNAVVIDSRAIQFIGRTAIVFVVGDDGTSFTATKVVTGVRGDDFGPVTEIVSGLSVGDRVVTVGSYGLKAELLRAKQRKMQERLRQNASIDLEDATQEETAAAN